MHARDMGLQMTFSLRLVTAVTEIAGKLSFLTAFELPVAVQRLDVSVRLSAREAHELFT